MNKEIYVVAKLSIEYDDEYYNHAQNGGGKGLIAYNEKEKADRKCFELNFEEYKGLRACEYFTNNRYGSEKNIEKINKVLNTEYKDVWEVELPKNLTEEQFKQLYKIINFKFYEVQTIKLDE